MNHLHSDLMAGIFVQKLKKNFIIRPAQIKGNLLFVLSLEFESRTQ